MCKKIPFIISLLTMVSGVVIAILFGVNESFFKDKISNDLQRNQKIMSIQDAELRNKTIVKEQSKNWRYYQRFHFHSTGIGAMSLAALLLFSLVSAPARLRLIGSYFISVGGFLYPFLWLLAGLFGPLMGRNEAKESFAIFGYMGGVFLIGLFMLVFALCKYPLPVLNENRS